MYGTNRKKTLEVLVCEGRLYIFGLLQEPEYYL